MSGTVRVGPGTPLRGTLRVPGDKSIAHRVLLLGALADGTSRLAGFTGGADVEATLDAIRRLGAEATWEDETVTVDGRGLALGPTGPRRVECANSGTTMRLVAGIVAARPGDVTLDGDASLRRRPMERIAAPLRAMGATVETTDARPPLRIHGARLTGIDFTPPVASAQVKSAVLLAGLRATGTTRVREPLPTRDHTERLLLHMGARLERSSAGVALVGGHALRPLAVTLPGDPSAAAFLAVAALVVPGSEVVVPAVGVNPTRTGAFTILRRMGARLELRVLDDAAGEPCADLVVRASALHGTTIEAAEIPAAIDELPVLAVAAAFAQGETRVRGAGELRVKESDRLAALAQLRALGADLTVQDDGFVVRGTGGRPLRGGRIDPAGDHRIAMAFAVAGLRTEGGVTITDPACARVSFPGYFDGLATLGATVEEAAP